jgi:cobalt-zinc-cadmium efflux system outer membrane protein
MVFKVRSVKPYRLNGLQQPSVKRTHSRSKHLLLTLTLALGSSLVSAQDPTPLTIAPVVEPAVPTSVETAATNQTAAPDAQPGWTLAALEQLAMQNHPAIAQQMAMISAAQGNWVQVGLQANPTIGYEGQQLGSRGLAEQEGIAIGQEIIRPGKLKLNRSIAAAEIAQARQELAVIQRKVGTDVKVAYFDLLIAQQRYAIAQQLLQIAQQGTQAARQLLEAKEVGKADLLQATIEEENSQIVLQNATNKLLASWQIMASLTGLSAQQPELVLGEFEQAPLEITFDNVLVQLRSTSPEIAVAVAGIETAQRTLARERFEPRPNVSINGLVNYRDEGIGGSSDGGVAVSVPVPLWNKNQGRIREAYFELQAAQRALEKLELDLQNRLAPVFERYGNSKNQYQRYREIILPAAKESLDLNRQAYTAGEVGFVVLLTAQRTYFETNLQYLDATRELRLAESEIEGLLLMGSFK